MKVRSYADSEGGVIEIMPSSDPWLYGTFLVPCWLFALYHVLQWLNGTMNRAIEHRQKAMHTWVVRTHSCTPSCRKSYS